MARLISKSLARSLLIKPHISSKSIHSKAASQVAVMEVEVDDGASGIGRLEEALQSIIARRAAPDWLPFLPGYSYYVPPPPNNLFQLFGRLSNSESPNKPNKTKSFRPDRTWPSSTYFIHGTGPTHPLPLGSVVDVKLYDYDEAAQESSSEDE